MSCSLAQTTLFASVMFGSCRWMPISRESRAKSAECPQSWNSSATLRKSAEASARMAAATHDLTKLPKAAGPLMKWIDEKWFRFRMRPLLGVLNFYENSSVREMANVTKRLFGRELSSGDVERARRYAAAVTKYAPKLGMAD